MEVELKFLIEETSKLEEYLKSLSKTQLLEILDIYFDDENFHLLNLYNFALRLRKENSKFFITMKRKLNESKEVFKRIEIEKEITHSLYEKMKRSSFYFCFEDIKLKVFPRISVFSKRKLFTIEDMKVSIDRVIFNDSVFMDFLEIEGDEEKILNFSKELKLKFNLLKWDLSKLDTALKFSHVKTIST
ncbi:MAG: hypothetical protein N2504_04870 [candidate division WOR-3 bacterium]|nr:hypothetical protein [candidate division WOR-3 bacterium]MCX7947901.1 hypothetical protein [candidate division WOR-3 bacterium]MDW8150723.1 hypothetical protein [candidate division WOR-3 bacterium]